jgi:prefoldin alpha subunit
MEKDKQGKIIAYRAYGARVQELSKQAQTLSALLNENSAASTALDNLPSEQTFFPLGSGVLVKAKVADTQKVAVELGAGVIAEKNVEDAKKLLGERRKQIEESIQKTNQEAQRLTVEMKKIEDELNG